VAAGAATVAGLAPGLADAAPAAPAPPVETVLQWNAFLLGLQADPGVQPATVHPTYELALLHTAIYDAVVSIEQGKPAYLPPVTVKRPASPGAAADAAARETLTRLYPGQRPAIDAQYSALIAQVTNPHRRAEGVRIGRAAADELLAARAGDRSNTSPFEYHPTAAPGSYQLTPPAFAAPAFTQWSVVKPFVLQRAAQFRPPAPPPVTSPEYAAALNDVKALGDAQSTSRTPEQTEIARFWNPPIWATWNAIGEHAALAAHSSLSENAHTFAALDLTLADTAIAMYDGKYTLRWWRPVTAIRAADTDGNPDTTGDPNWTPLTNTAPDPSYPGAHATISAAASDVLTRIYGARLTFSLGSSALPGVTRTFAGFAQAAREASDSRIFNGNHTRIDEAAGEQLGHSVATFVLAHGLRRPRG